MPEFHTGPSMRFNFLSYAKWYTVMLTIGVCMPRLHKIFTHSMPRLRMEYFWIPVSLKILNTYITGLSVTWRQIVSKTRPSMFTRLHTKLDMCSEKGTQPKATWLFLKLKRPTPKQITRDSQFSKAWNYIIEHPWNFSVIRAEEKAR